MNPIFLYLVTLIWKLWWLRNFMKIPNNINTTIIRSWKDYVKNL